MGQIFRNAGFINETGDPVQDTKYWQEEFYLESFDLLRRIESETKKCQLLNGLEKAQVKAEGKIPPDFEFELPSK